MAIKILIVAFCSALLTPTFALPFERVTGGVDGQKAKYSFQVSIRRNNEHICSGSVINEIFILTAAHCLGPAPGTTFKLSELSIRSGSMNIYAGGNLTKVRSVKMHENYGNFVNDIGLIETMDPIIFPDGKVSAIDLPTEDIVNGTEVRFGGWGAVESGGKESYKLLEINMKAISPSECADKIGFGYQSVLCLTHDAGKGSCNGDGGGGAVVENTVVGINSFAVGKCGSSLPDGFTRVFYYLSWIETNTQ